MHQSHTHRLGPPELVAIFLGGAAGALLRVWLGVTFAPAPASWPWATFLVNVSGCFALGCLAAWLHERPPQRRSRHPLLAAGFCGAYSTFSTMQIEILRMIEHDRYTLAAGYATASITAGYLAIWIATARTRRTPQVLEATGG
jgi:fluoride exporter